MAKGKDVGRLILESGAACQANQHCNVQCSATIYHITPARWTTHDIQTGGKDEGQVVFILFFSSNAASLQDYAFILVALRSYLLLWDCLRDYCNYSTLHKIPPDRCKYPRNHLSKRDIRSHSHNYHINAPNKDT